MIGGGCDYYPGSASSSPSFTFAVSELRIAGEGDLLVQLERLRRRLPPTGCSSPRSGWQRPLLPRTIGVVTGERGKARDDVLAGLRRRGWAGRLVWAFVPVQDRHAAPRIAAALRELAAIQEVEVVIVARGGGSLADLFAFCDEALCRTVALLRVPVISSVGHHTDRTLIDDVAAVCCSTPTHAAEAAVPIDCNAARADAARRRAGGCDVHGRRAILERARTLERLAAAPAQHVARQRRRLHQLVRELRASARRARLGGPLALPAATRSCSGAPPSGRAARPVRARARARAPGAGARGARSRSGRSRAATRWSRTAPASRWARPPRRAPRGELRLRFHDDAVAAERDERAGCQRHEPTAPTYETAVARIEEIIRRLDSGEAGLRETLVARQGGTRPRRVLRQRTRRGRPRPRGAQLDELVARLEGAQAARSDR